MEDSRRMAEQKRQREEEILNSQNEIRGIKAGQRTGVTDGGGDFQSWEYRKIAKKNNLSITTQ